METVSLLGMSVIVILVEAYLFSWLDEKVDAYMDRKSLERLQERLSNEEEISPQREEMIVRNSKFIVEASALRLMLPPAKRESSHTNV